MALFDKSAKDYDGWYNSPVGKYVDESETQCMFSLINDIAGAKVLDVGCGTGHLSEKLRAKGADVTGIDVSKEMLKKAEESSENKNLGVMYLNMDVCDLSFEEESFDYVFSMAAFEFIENPTLAFKNIKRVLKPNGTVVIGTIHKNSSWADMYESDAFKETVFANARFKKLSDFEAIDGFEVVKSKQCLFIAPGENENLYTTNNEITWYESGKRGGFLCVKMIKL